MHTLGSDQAQSHEKVNGMKRMMQNTAGGVRTQNNFYHAQQMQDMNKRPGSANVVPRPKVVSSLLIVLEKQLH